MRNHVLCNLILNGDDFLGGHPGIILRTVSGTAVFNDASGELEMCGDIDFTTYLNALSIGKWRIYADVSNTYLRLVHKGGSFDVYATWLEPDSYEIERMEHKVTRVEGDSSWRTTDVVIPAPAEAHIVSFALACDEPVRLRGGCWYTMVNEDRLNHVRLAIATTTFCKESYVLRNIEAIRSELFGKDRSASRKYHLFVVDNGRTLDAKAFSDNNITVLYNPNVGGSGGFARGMMAALDDGATHVLLMDDDVRVFPESFKRTYSLLRLANETYANAFVEGAMLNMEDPNLLFEDVATVKRDGMYERIKPDLFIDTEEDVALCEAIDVEQPRAYGAWWYCCIPTSVVREQGLPLPLFVRCDDVEYGMRCKPTLMTMNGICVWHERFEGRFRASVDSYQLTRNFLIMSACDELDPSIVRAFIMRFSRTFHIYLRSMNYDTCELMLDGLADYLKGPAFIREADGEEIMRANGRRNEALEDVATLDSAIVEQTVPNPRFLGQGRDRGMLLKTLEMIPHDRHMLPDWMLLKKPAPMYYSRGAYPGRKTMLRRTLVAYDQTGTKAHVRTMDRARWHRLRERYTALMREYRKRGKQVAREYRDAMPELTSRAFWESYLGMTAD